MTEYTPPISQLLTLGTVDYQLEWLDYANLGITAAGIPQLVALVQDQDLARSEGPEFFAQVHAWRALGQFRAEAAIEPLLDRLATEDTKENWNDWVTEEVPVVLGMMGPAVIAPLAARVQGRNSKGFVPCYHAHALKEIARQHPETLEQVKQILTNLIENAANQQLDVNGCNIAYLLDLNAAEAWPAIEAAFAAERVDEWIAGDADEVKFRLGLGPMPPPRNRIAQSVPRSGGLTKERAEQRKRERKARKKKRKQRSR